MKIRSELLSLATTFALVVATGASVQARQVESGSVYPNELGVSAVRIPGTDQIVASWNEPVPARPGRVFQVNRMNMDSFTSSPIGLPITDTTTLAITGTVPRVAGQRIFVEMRYPFTVTDEFGHVFAGANSILSWGNEDLPPIYFTYLPRSENKQAGSR